MPGTHAIQAYLLLGASYPLADPAKSIKIDALRLSDNPPNSPHIRAPFHEFQDFSEKI